MSSSRHVVTSFGLAFDWGKEGMTFTEVVGSVALFHFSSRVVLQNKQFENSDVLISFEELVSRYIMKD